MRKTDTTHFGYKTVLAAEKTKQVGEVFHTVAKRYDLMNDIMSLGLHRAWKHYTLFTSGVRKGQKILDIAGGTGDLAKGFLKKTGPEGIVYLADINASMLKTGRSKLLDEGFFHNLFFVQTDAENLSFRDNYFDCVSMGFPCT
jgi:demethylmenaquinone methyltransferase/2-methoxy-6-polyprenyl-1,4-benzoquinol methylase